MTLPLRPNAALTTLAWLALGSACSSIDTSSSNAADPVEQATFFMTSFGSISLGIGTTALTTNEPSSGRALEDRREISLAIARGSGPFVTDLAHWLALPPSLLPVLGRTLRAARPVLEPALDAPLTVRSFTLLVGVALCRQPQLRYHAWRRYPCEALAPLEALPIPPEGLLPVASPDTPPG